MLKTTMTRCERRMRGGSSSRRSRRRERAHAPRDREPGSSTSPKRRTRSALRSPTWRASAPACAAAAPMPKFARRLDAVRVCTLPEREHGGATRPNGTSQRKMRKATPPAIRPPPPPAHASTLRRNPAPGSCSRARSKRGQLLFETLSVHGARLDLLRRHPGRDGWPQRSRTSARGFEVRRSIH